MTTPAARSRIVSPALVVAAILVSSAQAGTTWDGGGANANWTTGLNWNPATGMFQFPPGNNGFADIHFAGTLGPIPNVDVPYSINSLTFDSGSISFIIVGQELTIGAGGVTNNDNSNQIVFAPVQLAANQTWTAAAGLLQMDVVDLNGFNLTLNGSLNINLPDVISGAGNLTVADAYTSTVTMSGPGTNTYTGLTDVQGGTLVLQHTSGSVAVPGDLTIGAGGTVRLAANEQIAETAGNEVTVLAGGLLDVNTRTETLAKLVINGGAATVAATGKLTAAEAIVTGSTATWTNSSDLYIGEVGTGTLDILAGGTVLVSPSNGYIGYIGYLAGSTGEVTVDGVGSTWTNTGSLVFGVSGHGWLDVTAGGQVSSINSYIGQNIGSSGGASVDGMGSSLINTGNLIVGNAGNGTLNITGGGDASNVNGYIGNQSGSTGIATVSGTGSTWTNSGALYVGNAGNGTLNITAGGGVTNSIGYIGDDAGTIGEVMVAGATWTNSGNLYVGKNGDGTLDVTGTGRVNSNGGFIGYADASSGEVAIDGSGSQWTTNFSDLFIGYDGNGTLNITNGGRVESTVAAVIGRNSGSTGSVTVEGEGSIWRVIDQLPPPEGQDLLVGSAGSGTLNIMDGGRLLTFSASLGYFSSAAGSVTVDGIGSNWDNSFLYVGFSGTGTLMVTNGGTVSTTYHASVGYTTGATGSVTIDGAGSAWSVGGGLYIGASSEGISPGTGSLTITNNGTVTVGVEGLVVGALGEVHGNGNIVGVVQNGGLVSPGTSPGALNLTGNYSQTPSGELLIELASASSYDQLLVTGDATLGGTLVVNLLGGFIPDIGQSFTILTADDVDGEFDTEPFPTASNFGFDVIYNADSVVLTVLSALPGDYNGNGFVDAADYTLWQDNLGSGTSLPNDDTTGVGPELRAPRHSLGFVGPVRLPLQAPRHGRREAQVQRGHLGCNPG